MKACKRLALVLILLLTVQFAAVTLAEDTPLPEETPAALAAADASIPAPDAADPDLTASPANAAIMLREGTAGARYQYWETALGHSYRHYPLKKVAVNMLRCALGDMTDAPVGRDPVKLRHCHEVPLPADGQEIEKEWCYNLHGALYSSTPLTSATAVLTPKDGGKEQSVTVTFDPAANVTAWSIDEAWPTVEQTSINDGLNFRLCSAGTWTLSISAATVGNPSPIQLYSATFKIVSVKAHKLTQNSFDDNWDEAYAFFGGDTEAFLFEFYPKNATSAEFISTSQAWVKKYIVKSELHGANVHVAALENFNLANQYLQSTYIKVVSTKYPNARVVQLDKLIAGGKIGTRVPRFQKNGEFISHHALGTCADINDKIYPNTNVETNHALIGDDVRNYLSYDGIFTDEKGQQYYQFTYTGSYRAYTDRIPNTILNYLLYELAFYRAGFGWGYYYETACDAMHYTVSEFAVDKHIDSDVGLRKVFEYYN